MTVESLAAQLAAFHPGCPQEEADRAEMLCFLQTHKKRCSAKTRQAILLLRHGLSIPHGNVC